MPAQAKGEVWKVPENPNGGIYNRDGKCRLRFGKISKSLELAFVPENKKKALNVLRRLQEKHRQEEVARHLGLKLPDEPRAVASRHRSLYPVIAEFEKARYPEMNPPTRQLYERSMNWAFRCDLPLEFEAIYQHLLDRKSSKDVQTNTLIKYLQCLRVFFRDYAVPRGLLDREPIDTLGIPKQRKKGRKPKYSPEQIARIISYLEQNEPCPDYALAVRFLSMTAARGMEALNIMWHEMTDAGLMVIPKGSLVRIMGLEGTELQDTRDQMRANGDVRWIPYRSIPGLPELIEEIRTVSLPAGIRLHRGPDYFFRWKDLTQLREAYNRARIAVGYPKDDGCTLHRLRASAMHWWEQELGWDRKEIIDVAGHTEEVHLRHYRGHPSAEELEARIERRRRERPGNVRPESEA